MNIKDNIFWKKNQAYTKSTIIFGKPSRNLKKLDVKNMNVIFDSSRAEKSIVAANVEDYLKTVDRNC